MKKTKAQDVDDLRWLISILVSDRGDQELLVPTAKHFPLSSPAVWLQDDVVGEHSCQNLECISRMTRVIMELNTKGQYPSKK